MIISLEIDVGLEVISVEGIKGKLRFCSNIVGFGRIGTGYVNFILTFELFIDSALFLFLEVIFKNQTKKRVVALFTYSEHLDHRFF